MCQVSAKSENLFIHKFSEISTLKSNFLMLKNCDVTIFEIRKKLSYFSIKCAKFQQNLRTFLYKNFPKFRPKNRNFSCLKIVTSPFSIYKKNYPTSALSVPSFTKIGEPFYTQILRNFDFKFEFSHA